MIGLGSDHGGYELKEKIIKYFEDKKIPFHDYGTYNGEAVDYPDIASLVCGKITGGEIEYAFLFCGTGIGISIAANKHKGIRAAMVSDTYSSKMAKEHNNANVICMGGRTIGFEIAREIVEAYMSGSFMGGRHQVRVDKIEFGV